MKERKSDFVVMPNHVHGIVIIMPDECDPFPRRDAGGRDITADYLYENIMGFRRDVALLRLYGDPKNNLSRGVSKNNLSLDVRMSKISPKKGSLSAIIRSYKSIVKRWCNQNGHEYFSWQSRFQ